MNTLVQLGDKLWLLLKGYRGTLLERAVLTGGLFILFIGGYFGVGLSTSPREAHELGTSLDGQIPFLARSVWIYLLIFPATLIPLFVVRCPRLLRRTALAYATTISVSLLCFTAFPVTSARLRVAPAILDMTRPSDWAVSILYSIDPPYNLFPSLHLSIALVAAFSAWKAARLYGTVAFVCLVFIGVSVCTVKQHVVVDALGGVALGTLVSAVILKPYRPQVGMAPAYSWRGPSLYLLLLVLVYTGFYLTYLMAS
ncbi:MAG: phosphatase PAP2 family protein [Acidobacteriota bacterium]|nr:phosphatase PAP2 family protein [Acidobacteriota bacterium]